MRQADAHHRRKTHERHVMFLARIIKVRGGDDDDYADRFLKEVVRQAKPGDRAIAAKLVPDADAWRRARRTYRHFFE